MPRVTFKDTTFAIDGAFTLRDLLQRFQTALRRNGGEYSYIISKDVDVFVAGRGVEHKVSAARTRGAIILNEEQALALLAGGFVDVETPQIKPELELGEAISELRAIFDGAPTSAAWTRCLEIIELCEPAQLEQLLHYAESFISRWDAHAAQPWEPPEEHILLSHSSPAWREMLALDAELRQAPPGWIFEMSNGDYFAKHGLVRGLSLMNMGVNLAVAKKILANKHLRQLKTLNFGDGAACHGVNFYKVLRRSEVMRTVETLTILSLDSGLERGILNLDGEDHTFASLKHLRIFTDGYHTPREILPQLRAFPALQGVTITVEPLYRALRHAAAARDGE